MPLSDYLVRLRGSTDPPAIREPAVAGRFYSDDPAVLRRGVEALLARARPRRPVAPIAIVAPHAGYVYSGQIAADAFAQAAGEPLDLVVILGANHTGAGVGAISAYPGRAFRTPLGVVEVDQEALAKLIDGDPFVVEDAAAHAAEHSIEVHVPFVQALFPAARILPVVVGTEDVPACERLGLALAAVLDRRRALVVASSDLSHYPSAEDARESDWRILEEMVSLDPRELRQTAHALSARGIPHLVTAACGLAPVLAAEATARARGARRGRVVSYANSSDVAIGDAHRVVGYGAVAFAPGEVAAAEPATWDARGADQEVRPIDREARRSLLRLARDTITQYLESDTLPLPRDVPAHLHNRHQGAFVTLRCRGRLRGCIGRLEHCGPLPQLVSAMAYDAAFKDPRFSPLAGDELDGLDVEVSLLTAPGNVASADDIALGRDGVILKKEGRTAVFLPKVATEHGWTREELLDQLCLKAGLARGAWKRGAMLSTFQADVFGERDSV